MQNFIDKLIERVDEDSFIDDGDCLIFVSDVKEITKELAAQHNKGWISCKDKLPESNEVVLICTDKGIVRTGYYMASAIINKSCWIVNGFSPMSEYKVIAWQQLPAPYKENSKEG